MAKVVITIQDKSDGSVEFKSEPNFSQMMQMHISGSGLTGAHGIAIAAMNAILREKKSQQKKSSIFVPKIY